MSDKTGTIVGINSHDYVSDVNGKKWNGCLATLRSPEGERVSFYTESLRLQQTLEMAYATGRRVTVNHWDEPSRTAEALGPTASADMKGAAGDELFIVKAIWTRE